MNGKRSIVPTVSPVSVSACAHWPITKLYATTLFRQTDVEEKADEDAERERVGETYARPAAMELRRDVGLELDADQRDAVHEPLRQQVGRIRADEERHEGDALPQVLLDDVRLEVVRGPAHLRAMRTSAGRSTTQMSR